MRHPDLSPDQGGLAISLATRALGLARGAATARPGTIYIPNSDGTGTIIGPGAPGGGVAEWVGDETPPGRPSGISCRAAWGSLHVEWDGSLEGGVPADFSHVSVIVDGAEAGRLAAAGSLVVGPYGHGAVLHVSAVACDAARDRLGNPAPNASEPWGPVEVRVSDERVEIDADVQAAADAAKDAGARADAARAEAGAVRDEAKAGVAEAKADALAAAARAEELSGKVTDVTATVNGQATALTELSSKVTGAVEEAGAALTTATEAKQTATGLTTKVEQTMQDAAGALSQATEAKQTADSIGATLTRDYVSKADASKTYSTKAELKATSESLTTTITETATKADSAVTAATEAKQTAAGLSAKVTETAAKADSAVKSASTAQQTADSIKSTVEMDYLKKGEASSTYATKSSVEQTASSIRQEVSESYQPKGDYATGAELAQERLDRSSAIEQSAAAIKSSVSQTYQQKGDYATKGEVGEVDGKVDGIASDLPKTYATKTSVEQTAESIRTEASKTYQPRGDYATGAELGSYATKSYVDQRADGITSAVEEKYVSKTDASTTYASKSELKQTSDSISSTVTEVGKVAGDALKKATTIEQTAGGLEVRIDSAVAGVEREWYSSTSPASLAGGSWQSEQPEWTAGRYVWARDRYTDGAGKVTHSSPACLTGNTGAQGSRGPQGATGPKGDGLDVKDTRDDDQPPSWYFSNYKRTTVHEFKYCSKIGLPASAGTYCDLVTYVPWTDPSGGYAKQAAKVNDGREYWRVGVSDAEWSPWKDAYGTAVESGKTATNFLKFDSGGLVVGDMTARALRCNTRMAADAFEVRDGETVLSRLGAKAVELAMGARDGAVRMLGGLLSVEGGVEGDSAVATIRAAKGGTDASSPSICIKADGAYEAEVDIAAADSALDGNPAGVGHGMATIRATELYMAPSPDRSIPLHDGEGELALVAAKARDASLPPRWVRRGGWTQLQGRISTAATNSVVCDLNGVIDPMDIPPSGVNRNFCCFTSRYPAATNVYIDPSGKLVASEALDMIDLSAISFRST